MMHYVHEKTNAAVVDESVRPIEQTAHLWQHRPTVFLYRGDASLKRGPQSLGKLRRSLLSRAP